MIRPISVRISKQVTAAFAVFAIAAPLARAEAIQMTSNKWSVGDRVTITGPDLYGDYYRLRRLCFASITAPDSLTCFGRYDVENKVWVMDDDPYIGRWDQGRLEFTVPPTLPPRGTMQLLLFKDQLKCFGSAGCINSPNQETIDLGQFTTVPVISRVVDDATDLQPSTIIAGKTYRIEGSLFGSDIGTVSFGKSTTSGNSSYVKWSQIDFTEIFSWNDRQILFTPSKSFDISGGLQVSNGTNVSNIILTASNSNSSETTRPVTVSSSSSSAAVSSSTSARGPFTDIAADHPYASAIDWAKQQGILQGYPDGTFRPDMTVNRAEFLKIVLAAKHIETASGLPPTGFKDVDEQAWYMPFVRYAKQHGIIQGYNDGTFKPNQAVNFAEALKMAYVALGIDTPESGTEWYSRYLDHARSRNILFSDDVDLTSGMSRKDVVWIVRNLVSPE